MTVVWHGCPGCRHRGRFIATAVLANYRVANNKGPFPSACVCDVCSGVGIVWRDKAGNPVHRPSEVLDLFNPNDPVLEILPGRHCRCVIRKPT
jgi:hypothetical protein